MSLFIVIVRARRELRVGGLTPLTTIDYPDHLSCVIYCQGCSWRCRYCHNQEMITTNPEPGYGWNQVLNFLNKRRGLLEAVVFSGGEPLLQKYLPQAVEQVNKMGFKVGLHTAGSIPIRFSQVLPLIDWVGFDVKDLPSDTDNITQVKGSGQKNWQSLKLLLASHIDFQCRTTVHWQLIDEQRLVRLTERLADLGVVDYVIQFSRTNHMLDSTLGYSVLPGERIEQLKSTLTNILPTIKFAL
ncbi:MAG: anaerobic ribonucleoside-triphosphate reductase activating protein [Alcanivoracaceae bacterium]|nr:anaerobic ribonucleoside-triphosphate reductase activating protein [Alcanivoracaceae bacterium]